ncbi:PilZ domain-containing protein [Stakelama saccharophila]|uniref:PilZ domain-containing protein n=1 Tax=Stakelama saccharophila TaxID=3075605 RepID=A0ABZ0B9I9_9SPHN|nr:PilZ domain-containing protein [Stakelama sp. W311]WNO53955.1 PilZ domain-containing protein [Stakelama sp. W311]
MTQYRPVGPALVEQRRAPRHPVFVTRATTRRHKQEAVEARLCDLSAYGCRLAGDDQPDGERLWLRFEGSMPVAATAVWSRDGMVGCRFDEPIDRKLVRALTLTVD